MTRHSLVCSIIKTFVRSRLVFFSVFFFARLILCTGVQNHLVSVIICITDSSRPSKAATAPRGSTFARLFASMEAFASYTGSSSLRVVYRCARIRVNSAANDWCGKDSIYLRWEHTSLRVERDVAMTKSSRRVRVLLYEDCLPCRYQHANIFIYHRRSACTYQLAAIDN